MSRFESAVASSENDVMAYCSQYLFRFESAGLNSRKDLMAYCVRSRQSTLKQYMHFFSEQSTCEQGKKQLGVFFT